jgi:hypothetical protein
MVRASRANPMSATATMFIVIRPDGYGKRTFITLPRISSLVDRTKYFVLTDDPDEEPEPPRELPKRKSFARRYRDLGEALED